MAVRPEHGQNLGVLRHHLFYGQGSTLGEAVAKLVLPPEPRRVAKFRKCRLSDVEKSGDGRNKT